MRASDVQREIDRMTTTRIVTDSNGRKHITTEPLLHPEQEPVAWRNAAIRVGEDLCSVGPFGYYDMTAEQWLDWALSVVTVHAPPPQRTWVGLTDGEVDKMILLMGFPPDWITENAIVKNIVRNLEAKLKEKNS